MRWRSLPFVADPAEWPFTARPAPHSNPRGDLMDAWVVLDVRTQQIVHRFRSDGRDKCEDWMRKHRLTDPQEQAVIKLFNRDHDGAGDYETFRARFKYDALNRCLMGPWAGMVMGIELNGYAHS